MTKSSSNLGFASLTAAVLLIGGCTAGTQGSPEPKASMTLDETVAALTSAPAEQRSTLPLCELELARPKRPLSADWYTCSLAPERYESLPIGQLDEDDFKNRLTGIGWECELRRLHGAPIELPGLHPSSPAHRLGWREGDLLTGLTRINDALVVNLTRGYQDLVLIYEIG
jgi:hypothetical protein